MSTMRTPAEDAALSAFTDAATSDEDPGYPQGAAFIAWQQTPQTDRVLWPYLHEGRPAVIVGTNDLEMLIEPVPLAGSPGFATKFFSASLSRFPIAASKRRLPVICLRYEPTSAATHSSV